MDWLLFEVAAVVTVDDHGKRADLTKEERGRIVRELASRLPEHRVWDGNFLPDQDSLPAAHRNEPGSVLSGTSRFSIRRLIPEKVLERHLESLTSAAREYRTWANELMRHLAAHLGVEVGEFAASWEWHNHEQIGSFQIGEEKWDYFFHGEDCAFANRSIGIMVEARLGFGPLCGEEFGVFDPWFFFKFMRSTLVQRSDYREIVETLDDCWDHAREALEFMERRHVLRLVSTEDKMWGGWVLA